MNDGAKFARAALLMLLVVVAGAAASQAQDSIDRPVIVVETSRGTLAFETFPGEAPTTVAHVLGLVRAGFYDGQRVHRAQPGFVVQFGDPQTRDVARRDLWGRGDVAGSGKPVGAAELSKKHRHVPGAVGLSHRGNPYDADSQIYITLSRRPELDGRYVIFGQIISGGDVAALLEVGDEIRRVYVRP
jgi:cyclophilin family peptidyl-prolyl cis-trans isomerase